MSDEKTLVKEMVSEEQYRDLRTQEICNLAVRFVLVKDKQIEVLSAIYARGYRRDLEVGEEKNFKEIEAVKPLAEGEAEASGDNTVDSAAQ